MTEQSPLQATACAEYEALLKESHRALTNWKNGREEICQSARKGRKTDNELRVLQAAFAKSYAALQCHGHVCEICQITSLISSGFAASSPSPGYQLHQ